MHQPDLTTPRSSDPLPCAVLGDQRNLSADALDQINGLMRRDPAWFLGPLVLNWVCVLTTIGLAVWLNNPVFTCLSVIFIGTRLNVFAVLLHEQVHRSAFRSKGGDLLTNLLVAFPLGVTVENYRKVHIAHHQGFFTPKDPDYVRKQGAEWTFPQKASYFLRTVIKDLLAMNLWKTIRSKKLSESPSVKPKTNTGTSAWVRVTFYASLAAVLTVTQTWTMFLLYWVLPWATVFQGIVRWAAVCEHKYSLLNPSVTEATPMIMLSWWERLLMPNLNFTTYHIYHHFFPRVPWSKLPQVHEIFRSEGLVNEDAVFRGYISYLKYLFGHRVPAVQQAATAGPSANSQKPAVATPVPRRDAVAV